MHALPVVGSGGDGVSSSVQHRARLLAGLPPNVVSERGRSAAAEFLANGSPRAASLLRLLPPELFRSYFDPLARLFGDAPDIRREAMEAMGIMASMSGCLHGCEMCYISAQPARDGVSMPWVHAVELLETVSRERRQILRIEMEEVLANEILCGRLHPPVSLLDSALALVRHSRNRYSNYSGNLMTYFENNPTDWRDVLFGRDYADLCQAVTGAFQLFDAASLVALLDADSLSQPRLRAEFGEDLELLLAQTSTHAVTSTVPFAKGSSGDAAIRRLLKDRRSGRELVRVSIPHPQLILTGRGNPERYWGAVSHSLRTAEPKLIYLFASTIAQLEELFERVAATFERSELPWWIECRLGLYEIRAGRKKELSDVEIVSRLRRVLKRVCFMGNLEGRALQFEGSPLFAYRGTTMCINGLVFAPEGRLHYQACTDAEGADLATGLVVRDVHQLPAAEFRSLITARPLTNRSRELVTQGLELIPLRERRKPWGWFARVAEGNRRDSRYDEAKAAADRVAAKLSLALRF